MLFALMLAGGLIPLALAEAEFGESLPAGVRDDLLEIIRTHRKVA